MNAVPKILDAQGQPMRVSARAGGGDFAHAAASTVSQELASWFAPLRSGDGAYLRERDTIVGRARDTALNNGWIAGAIQRFEDQAIGADLRLRYMPDARLLGVDRDELAEWARDVERRFMAWATDPRALIDAGQRHTLSSLMGMMFSQRMVDGECLAVVHHLPGRHGTPFGTCIQGISTDRLSNPNRMPDEDRLRKGVEVDTYGAPLAYHIQAAHPGDVGIRRSLDALRWERVPRYTPWGRARVIHFYETGPNPDLSRGKSPLAPVLEKLRMIGRYESVELQSAIVNAVFAAFITSPFDHGILGEALEEDDTQDAMQGIGAYQSERAAFHDTRNITLNGVRIPTLFPGEKIESFAPGRPNATFGPFLQTSLRYIASALGQSYEQLAQDWSSTNYSSARAAMLESWKYLSARRKKFCAAVPTQVFALWLEEAVEIGAVRLPAGAPDFWEAFSAWTRCRWIGPGRGWVDPVKEAQAAGERIDNMLSTYEDEAAEQGHYWQDIVDQRRIEAREMADMAPAPRPSAPVDEDPDAADRAERQQQADAALDRYEQRMAALADRAATR